MIHLDWAILICYLFFCLFPLQVLYEEILKDGYREERFRELAQKQGIQSSRVERAFKENKVPFQGSFAEQPMVL